TGRQIEQTERQVERTEQQFELNNQRVSILDETQTEFIQGMLQHVEDQREINASLRRKTSELSQVTEQRMSDLALAQQQTQRDISNLTKTVGELAKAFYWNGNPPQ